ncbi:MAG: hypothetical protein ACRC7V_09150 [Lachnospiraceae bacterium]
MKQIHYYILANEVEHVVEHTFLSFKKKKLVETITYNKGEEDVESFEKICVLHILLFDPTLKKYKKYVKYTRELLLEVKKYEGHYFSKDVEKLYEVQSRALDFEDVSLILESFQKKRNAIHIENLCLFYENSCNCYIEELILRLSDTLNEMLLITNEEESYFDIAEEVYQRTGLLIEFTDTIKGKLWEQSKGKTLILSMTSKNPIPFRAFPNKSIFFDVLSSQERERILRIRRGDMVYVSARRYLDSTSKNMYNTIVNEGIVNQS